MELQTQFLTSVLQTALVQMQFTIATSSMDGQLIRIIRTGITSTIKTLRTITTAHAHQELVPFTISILDWDVTTNLTFNHLLAMLLTLAISLTTRIG